MKILHRIIFYAAIVERIYFIYATWQMPLQDYEAFSVNYPAIVGLIPVYMFCMVVYALVDLFKNNRRMKIVWIPTLLVVWYVGIYIYFELYLFDRKEASAKNRQKDEFQGTRGLNSVPAIPQLMRKRAMAAAFDFAVFVALASFYIFLFGEKIDGTWRIQGIQHLFVLLVIWFLNFSFSENAWGQTLGKRITGIVVVNRWGEKPTLAEALIRHLLDVLDLVFFSFLIVVKGEAGEIPRRWGDKLARTWVIPLGSLQERIQNPSEGSVYTNEP